MARQGADTGARLDVRDYFGVAKVVEYSPMREMYMPWTDCMGVE